MKTVAALALAWAAAARAESTDAASEMFAPPELVDLPPIAYPADAPSLAAPVEVVVHLRIDGTGAVSEVELLQSAGEPFDGLVLEGARLFRFHPARYGGAPVEVIVPYTHTFLPRATAEAATDTGPARTALLEGTLVERGTRRPVSRAAVLARSGADAFTDTSGADGMFHIPVPAGEHEVRVAAFGYRRFVQKEKLDPDQKLRVRYLLERESYNMYESVIVGQRERTEVSRTTLRGREITQVPGTFGDPFRVIGALPGVAQVMSLLPLPIVRGASPGNTGFFLDGVRMPLLFHLLGGPAVVPPAIIDRVDFYPGGFPVSYGGSTAGIVDGLTARARVDERKVDVDVNLAQAGAFLRQGLPTLGAAATVAGRIGYPGVLLSLLSPTTSLSYWDYQTRLDGPNWTVFAYGARDALQIRDTETDEFQPAATFHFHRVDLRYQQGAQDDGLLARLVLGYDQTLLGQEVTSWLVEPRLTWRRPLAESLRLSIGGEGAVQSNRIAAGTQGAPGPGNDNPLTEIGNAGNLYTGGAYAELAWKLGEDLIVVPGVRGDVYQNRRVTQWSVDPRLMARWRVSRASVGGTWLKAAVGVFHQPPRLFVPVPGQEQSALQLGLLESLQTSVGAEVRLGPAVDVDVQTYFNSMDPVLFDLQVNPDLSQVQQQPPESAPWDPPVLQDEPVLGRFFNARVGRSYGLEILLRKRDTQGFFGWIAYTLSKSERKNDDGSWAPFDFDRTHIFNAVAGIRLPRNWEVGGRVVLQTGTPLTTIFGYNAGRGPASFRVDLRVDKRAVWDDWLLDFYVDVINATEAAETGGLVGGQLLRYVLPTVGFRAVL